MADRASTSSSVLGYVSESSNRIYYPMEFEHNHPAPQESNFTLTKILLAGGFLLMILSFSVTVKRVFYYESIGNGSNVTNITAEGPNMAGLFFLATKDKNPNLEGLQNKSELIETSSQEEINKKLNETIRTNLCNHHKATKYIYKPGDEVYFENYTEDSMIMERLRRQFSFDDTTYTPKTKPKVILTLSPFDIDDIRQCSENPKRISKQKCDFTTDSARFKDADAVIFREPDLSSKFLQYKKEPKKVWIYNTMSPRYDNHSKLMLDNVFNLTATYNYQSHLPILPVYWLNNRGNFSKSIEKNTTDDKVRIVVFNKNCAEQDLFWGKYGDIIQGLEEDEAVVVDWYGSCNSSRSISLEPGCFNLSSSICFQKIATKYKFALAFEIYEGDYISERFFHPLINSIIPVVIGMSSRSRYEAVSPANSFIYYCDHSSQGVRGLTTLLKRLNRNEDEFKEYFKWMEKTGTFKPYRYWYCQVCATLYKAVNITTVVDDLENWR